MTTKMRYEPIPLDQIEANPENPRQSFPEDKIVELAESILAKGVLVPITVFRKGPNKYVLLDGQRRWLASKRINLPSIPAWVMPTPNPIKNLEAMFHIHMEREEWGRVDSLQALNKLIDLSRISDPAELQRMTGIPAEQVEELQRILTQPKEYQELIKDGTLPFNFFTELHHRVITPLKTRRPRLFKRFNEERITSAFVARRRAGALDNMTQLLREVNAIIHKASEAGATSKSVHDKPLMRVLTDPEYPISDAYEDVTGAALEVQKFARHCERFKSALATLIAQPLTPRERRLLRRHLRPLLKEVKGAVKAVEAP